MTAVIALLVIAALALAAPTLPAQEEEPPPVGAIVRSISVAEVPGDSQASLAGLIEVAVGEPFSPERIRATLKNIFHLGIYSDVRALWEEVEGEIALTIETVEIPPIERIMVRGGGTLGRRRLIRAARLERGQRFDRYSHGRAYEALAELHRQHGYYAAEIRILPTLNPETGGVRIEIDIEPGRPFLLRSVRIGGDSILPDAEILAAFRGNSVGGVFRQNELAGDLGRVHELYVERGYLTANVTAEEPSIDFDSATVDLELNIIAGPLIRPVFSPASAGRKQWLALIPFGDHNVPLARVLENGRQRIERQLRADGHAEAEVQIGYHYDPESDAMEVAISIDAGPTYGVGRLTLEGLTAELERGLRPRLTLFRRSWFSRPRYSEQALADDERRVLQLLRAAGYREARLLGSEVQPRPGERLVDVVLRCEPGPMAVAGALRFEGNNELGDTQLSRLAALEPGAPLTDGALEGALQRLRDHYDSQGFAEVNVELDYPGRGGETDLLFRIEEGERATVGTIIIAGNERTRDGVVRRALTVREGGPFSRQRINESRRALYMLGIFNRVDIRGMDSEAGRSERRLLVRLRETPPYTLSYGFGYDSEERLRLSFGFSNINLWGLNMEAAVSARVSRRQQRYQLSFRAPRLLRGRLDNYVRLFYEEVERPSFKARREGLLIESVGMRWGDWDFSGRYQFKLIGLYDVQPGVYISRFDQDVRLSLLSAVLSRDTRDDLFYPRSGSVASAIMQYSPSWLGSEVDYVKGLVQVFAYQEVLPDTVLAAGLRVGLAHPFSGTEDVPISERFFAGGSTTLRGFGLDMVGPNAGSEFGNGGERYPLGGDAMLVGNLELRFPLLMGVGGVLFYDVGNVYPRVGDVTLGDLTHSVGFGLRYRTPLGPLRVDFGTSLRTSDHKVFFNVGQAF